jgi:hypothetical protein
VWQADPIDEIGEDGESPFIERIEFRGAGLYPVQFTAIYDPARYSLIEATTKAGKTAGCLVWLMDQAAHGKPGWCYWWVAPVFPVATVAFRRMIAGMPPGMFEKNESELRVDLPNGTHIFFKSGEKPDNLYGEDVHAIVLDEASRMREESFIACRSTVTKTRGRMRIIGNVKGRKNWFYRMCRKAEAGEPNHGYHKITWRDAVEAKILEQAEIDDARRVLPEQAFKQLYEADPADDEGNPFGIEYIRACRIEKPSLNPVHSWGWDLARKVDWTVGIALDRGGQMVSMERFQIPWREVKTRIVAASRGRPALVDSTGIGDAILEDLQASPGGNFQGYIFTPKTKQALMDRLVVAIQHKEVGLTSDVLINELESFEYEYTAHGVRYSAPEGMHDDCVCALALAVFGFGPRMGEFRAQRVTASSSGGIDGPQQDGPGSRDYDDRVRIGGGWESRTGLI